MTRPSAAPRDSKSALTPKLRFPEFRDAPEWDEETVEELVDTITPPKKLPTAAYTGTGKFPIIDQSQTAVCGWTDDSEALISHALPLIVFGDHTCILKLIDQPFAQGADGIKILKARAKVDPRFLYHSLGHRPLATEEYKRHYSILKDRPVAFPNIKTGEQQKIAECLSTLDELIGAENQKLVALKAHKKGLMQQLFPREGETLPRLRFPKFQSAPEWTEKPIGDEVDLLSGYPFDGADITQHSSGNRLLRGINITEGYVRHNSEIDRYYLKPLDGLGKYKVQINDLVIGMDGSKVGKNSALITAEDSGALLVQRVARLRTRNPVTISFIYQRINSPNFHAYVDRINTSSGIPHISAKQIREFTIGFPSEAEQERIATCLSSLDDLIVAQSDKLEALHTHKQGLMQQLFPSPTDAGCMSTTPFTDLPALATHFRQELGSKKFILLYGYNGTGKTRLSTAFKNIGKKVDADGVTAERDTLYFNAFTEDLFFWDNDLVNDRERVLKMNAKSHFFDGLREIEMNNLVRPLMRRYADFDFQIEKVDDDLWETYFSRDVLVGDRLETIEDIKISRGEENIFIWCFFLAIVQLTLDGAQAYSWVKYIYIDDPISSLDEHNAIGVANHLAHMLTRSDGGPRIVVSSHHVLFFNVLCNELRNKARKHFLKKGAESQGYVIHDTDAKPFLHHLSNLVDLYEAQDSGALYTHHFNMMRRAMEQTANFFGLDDWKVCIKAEDDDPDRILYKRLIDLMSHGDYSLYEPSEMMEENKRHFRTIFRQFVSGYPFNPTLFPTPPASRSPAPRAEAAP